jgi:hypothetical protein
VNSTLPTTPGTQSPIQKKTATPGLQLTAPAPAPPPAPPVSGDSIDARRLARQSEAWRQYRKVIHAKAMGEAAIVPDEVAEILNLCDADVAADVEAIKKEATLIATRDKYRPVAVALLPKFEAAQRRFDEAKLALEKAETERDAARVEFNNANTTVSQAESALRFHRLEKRNERVYAELKS